MSAVALFWAIVLAALGQVTDTSSFLDCKEGQRGTRSAESAPLATKDRKFIAVARAEVTAACKNTSTLLVNGRIVFTERPTEELSGNGIMPVQWSRRGHLLAADLRWWQFGSDVGGLSLLLYDADRDRAWLPDIAGLFNRRFGKKCEVNLLAVLGFDARDRPLIEVDDYIEVAEDAPDPPTRCVGHRGTWAVDEGARTVEELRP